MNLTAYDVFNNARAVQMQEEDGVALVWHGGHTINQYQDNCDGTWEATNCYTRGDQAAACLTTDEAMAAMEQLWREMGGGEA